MIANFFKDYKNQSISTILMGQIARGIGGIGLGILLASYFNAPWIPIGWVVFSVGVVIKVIISIYIKLKK